MQPMKQRGWVVLAAVGLVSFGMLPMGAQQQPRSERPQRPDEPATQARQAHEPEQSKDAEKPVPLELKSVTEHVWTAGGHSLHYTATAGNLLIADEDEKPNGSLFYVAYTADGVAARERPVTFFYNGGPGSATIWLHMGSLGPVRVVTASPEATPPAPYRWVPNESSLLDKSDLVFIDAPMTGFSRAVGKGTAKDFAGTDKDIRAYEKFIVRYITLNQRWASPKFLFGESYGTPRSAGLAAVLQNDGVALNGVTLLSSILNYGVRIPGYDTEAVGYFPSYAAIAYYYKKVPQTGSLADWVQKAREFARGPYLTALQQGDTLPAAEVDRIAAQMAQFTGLSVTYLKQTNLRIAPTRFRKELLRGDDEILGRYDARFEGYDVDAAGESPGYDPSDTGISGAFVGAFHDYLQSELKYMSADTYNLQGPGINQNWDFHHRASGTGGGQGGRGEQVLPDTAIDLADAMRKNPHLKVFSANGYFDLATPFFATEFDLAHMMLTPALRKNLQFGYYPAGHMVYLNVDALKSLHADMDRFYDEATRP